MKLSFSLASSKPPKPTLKPSQNPSSSSVQKQFVTEFDPSKPPTNPDSKHVDSIAPIANNWRIKKKTKVLDLPDASEDPNLQFESVSSTVEEIDSNIAYGLNVRAKKDPEAKAERVDRVGDKSGGSAIDRLMLDKLKSDLASLPDDRGFDEFEDMPVESFAAALLKGYGWHEGKGVGKNAKEDVKVFEFKQRTGKEGLGFVNDVPVPPTHDGSRNREVKVKKETVGNGERKERSKDLTSSRNNNDNKHDADYERKKSSKRERERYESKEASGSQSRSWLNSHIRVRIISKKLKGGRLYLKKGEIVDVVGPTTCDISMDNSRELIQGVEQEFLETALPRHGGPVLVLSGRHKGVFGSLQEKDMDNETAVVRDADTHALLNVRLEQIAEYVGDPDDIGY